MSNGEGAGEIDALALAAGEVARHAVGQGGEFEEIEDLVKEMRGGPTGGVGSEANVPADVEMGKESGTLRSIGEASGLRRRLVMLALQFRPADWVCARKHNG